MLDGSVDTEEHGLIPPPITDLAFTFDMRDERQDHYCLNVPKFIGTSSQYATKVNLLDSLPYEDVLNVPERVGTLK
jgi:hypothetical protein